MMRFRLCGSEGKIRTGERNSELISVQYKEGALTITSDGKGMDGVSSLPMDDYRGPL